MLKVENHPNLLRDPHNFAIINTDVMAKRRAVKSRNTAERIEELEKRFDKIEQMLSILIENVK